MQLKHSHKFSK